MGDLQEWSYSLPGIESEMRTIDGETVRILKKITVNEVSPVLRGAGNGTRTLDIKDGKPTQTLDHIELVTGDVRAVVEKLSHVTDLRTADGRGPGAERVKRATELEQALEQLARELARLKAVGSDEPTEIEVAMLVELTRFTLMSTAQRR